MARSVRKGRDSHKRSRDPRSERESKSEEPLRRARTLLPDKAPPYTVRVIVPMALSTLTRATLFRLEGRDRDAADVLAKAEEIAAADGVDPELVRALLERVGGLRVVTRDARRSAKGEQPDLSSYAVILDGRSHELRVKTRVISLGKRPAMRRLLYELASRPNEVFSKDALASCLWSSRYNPLTHDNALWVNVRRLRVLLGKSGLTVELAEHGYRLRVPERFVYLDPGRSAD